MAAPTGWACYIIKSILFWFILLLYNKVFFTAVWLIGVLRNLFWFVCYLFLFLYYLKWLAHRHYTNMYRLLAATAAAAPGGVPWVLAPLGQASRTIKICTSKNGGTSAVSLVTGFCKAERRLTYTCLDDPLRSLTIGLGDREEMRRK